MISLVQTRRLFSNASIALALAFLTACGPTQEKRQLDLVQEEVKQPEARPPLPRPRPIQTLPVEWQVLTPATPPKGDYTYFALDSKNYENLSRNFGEIERYTGETDWHLRYYRKEDTDARAAGQ